MSWSSRSLAQSSQDTLTAGRRDLAKRFMAHRMGSGMKERSTTDPAVDRRRLCWLCGLEIAIIEIGHRTGVLSLAKGDTAGHDLCLGCAEDTLRFVFLPLTAEKLLAQDMGCEDAIAQFEANGGVSSTPCSPRSPQPNGQAEWSCWRCTLVNHGLRTSCESCGSSRPADPVCPRCDLNYLHHKLCLATKAKHQTWECSRCQTNTVNIDELVECRACRKPRTWFCAACSLENSATHNSCSVCGSVSKLSSLRSFVNREMLREYGINAEVQEAQRQKVGQVELHTERLRHRIESIGLQSVPIDDDGNCLFRALSYELVRTDAFYPVVRHLVADYMEDHRTDYSLLVGAEEFESYVAGMRQNRVWGDELCVHAAARAFGLRIHVVTSEEQRWHLRYVPPGELQLLRQLFLAYRSPDHYFALQHSNKEPSMAPVPLDDLLRTWAKEMQSAPLTAAASTPQLSPENSAEFIASAAKAEGQLPLSMRTQQQVSAPGVPSSSQATAPRQMENVTITRTTQHLASDSPPLAKRQPPSAGPPQRFIVPPAPPPLPSSVATTQQAPPSRFVPPSPSSQPAAASVPTRSTYLPSTTTGTSTGSSRPAPPPQQQSVRPESRSSKNEVLPINLFHMLKHPIMVRLYIAGSSLTVAVNDKDVLTQNIQGAFFYLYPITHKAILECGPNQYPWREVYPKVVRDLQESKANRTVLLPMFLLQHISTGGFVHPSEDVRSAIVFADLPPIQITEINCKKRTQRLGECLLTIAIDANAPPSRSKAHLKFVHNSTPCVHVSFVGHGSLFASEMPVPGSAVIFHQLFGGLPERLCLHCHQWYHESQSSNNNNNGRAVSQPQRLGGQGCSHVSWVDETLEQLQPVRR